MTKGKGTKRAAAPPPALDMTTLGRDRVVNVTVSKQAEPCMREIGGSEYEVWDSSLLHRTMMTLPSYVGSDGQPLENYNAAIAGLGLRAFAPKDPVEAMLASAAVAMHAATLECSRRAMIPQQQADVASRLRRDAANSARALVEVTEVLERRRGRGPQVVRVERVVVNEGGRAVVGSVTSGTSALTSPPSQQAITQGAPPFVTGDALHVVAGDRGEGEGA